jgi:hypothetical protein
MSAQRFLATMFVLACLASLAACTTGGGASVGSRYMVSAPRAQFYKYGPAQAFGADLVLNHGQKVTMLETSFGYSKVMTEEGISGYVASDELEPAPPEPAAPKGTPTPKGSRSMIGSKAHRSDVESTPGAPLFDIGDMPPPPLPDHSEPKPAPKLRY